MWVDYHVIVTAFGLTAGITVFLLLFAFISKSDFSGIEPYLYQIFFIAIFFGGMTILNSNWVSIFSAISVWVWCG